MPDATTERQVTPPSQYQPPGTSQPEAGQRPMEGTVVSPAGAAPATRRNGFAVTSLVLGILSLFLVWTGLLEAALVVLAIIFGAAGISRSNQTGVGRGMAIAGLACGIVGGVGYVILGSLIHGFFIL